MYLCPPLKLLPSTEYEIFGNDTYFAVPSGNGALVVPDGSLPGALIKYFAYGDPSTRSWTY